MFGFVGNDAGTEKYLIFFPSALLDVVLVFLAIRFYLRHKYTKCFSLKKLNRYF